MATETRVTLLTFLAFVLYTAGHRCIKLFCGINELRRVVLMVLKQYKTVKGWKYNRKIKWMIKQILKVGICRNCLYIKNLNMLSLRQGSVLNFLVLFLKKKKKELIKQALTL